MCDIIHQIAKGFSEDASRIIYRFKNSENQDFKCFSNIWLDMKFAQIFTGRRTAAEVMELSEECLNVSKYFLVHNEAKIKIGGLFLIYSLYYCQPIATFAKIRLLQSEWLIIKNWWLKLDKNKDDEPIFIFLKLYYDNAFKFVLENRSYGLEKSINKYFKELPNSIMMPFHLTMEDSAIGDKDKNELNDLAQKAKTSYEEYQLCRRKLNLGTKINSNLFSVLTSLSAINITNANDSQNIEEDQDNALGVRRKMIKNKAFATNESSYFRSPDKKKCKQESSDEHSVEEDDDSDEIDDDYDDKY